MPPVVVPNCARVALEGTIQGANWANILHYQYTGPPLSNADCLTIANTVASEYQAQVLAEQSSDLFLVDVAVRDLGVAFGSQAFVNVGVAGSDATEALPFGVAVKATLLTNLHGRPFRGFMYIGGATQAWQDATNGNNVDAVVAAFFTSALSAFRAGTGGMVLSAGVANWAVATIKSATVAPQANDITNATIDGRFHYQKRRGIKP